MARVVNSESAKWGVATHIRGNASGTDWEKGSTATKLLGAFHESTIVGDTAVADAEMGEIAEGKRKLLLDMEIYSVSHCVPFETGGAIYIYLANVVVPV